MGGRPVDNSAAAQVVSESLGLDEDFFKGVPEDEAADEPEPDDTGEGSEVDETPIGDEARPDDGIEEQAEASPFDGLLARAQPEPAGRTKFDKAGNVVDAKTGVIVAAKGAAARFYQDAYKAKQESVTHKARADDLQGRLDRAIEIGEAIDRELQAAKQQAGNPLAKQLGLADPEVADALQLAAEAKRDPIGSLQKLLTRAAANGIDISKLGGGATGFNPATFMAMVREEIAKGVKPIEQQNQSQRAQQEATERRTQLLQRTEASVQRYFEENRDQVPYLPIYKAVLENPQFRGMPLTEIGLRIKMNLLQQRYENGGQRRQNPQARSMPNGRSTMNGAAGRDGQGDFAHPSQSWDDILKPIVAQHYRA